MSVQLQLGAAIVVGLYGATLVTIWLLPSSLLGGKATGVRVMASVVAVAQMIVYALWG